MIYDNEKDCRVMTGQMMKTHTAPIFMISIIIFMHSTNSSLSVLFVGFIYFKSFYLGNLLAGCDWQPWKKKSAIQRTDIKFPHAALPVCLSSSGPQQKSKRTSEHLSVVTLKVWSGILSSTVTHKSCLGGYHERRGNAGWYFLPNIPLVTNICDSENSHGGVSHT